MNFWKKHLVLRSVLMVVFFATGLIFVGVGWSMTGEFAGLGLMMAGIILMLTTLLLYNKACQ